MSPDAQAVPLPVATRPKGRVHVVGAGPIGLLLTALLQSEDGPSIHLIERRTDYTRTRMVSLAPYLIADSIESYQADPLDGVNVQALFDDVELETRLAYRRKIAPDLLALLREWTQGFVPLNTVERSLSELIDSRGVGTVERTSATVTTDEAIAMVGPDDILVDSTGTRSLMRDHLVDDPDDGVGGGNTQSFRLEYALVITFLYSQNYACNEYCKWAKNSDNPDFKFIPAVHRTFHDGSVSHVTGIVRIDQEAYESMPSKFDGEWLRANHPEVAASMDRFIERIQDETHGELVGPLEIVRIPLDLYRARNVTSRRWYGSDNGHPLSKTPVFLVGDTAIASPYFQSITLGFECAFFLAGHINNRAMSIDTIFDRYEMFMYQQWLRVYMRTRMIKHNKDVLESVDDTLGLLEKLHIF